jgi:hypothetical protein
LGAYWSAFLCSCPLLVELGLKYGGQQELLLVATELDLVLVDLNLTTIELVSADAVMIRRSFHVGYITI